MAIVIDKKKALLNSLSFRDRLEIINNTPQIIKVMTCDISILNNTNCHIPIARKPRPNKIKIVDIIDI